jgi:hypothetical protein
MVYGLIGKIVAAIMLKGLSSMKRQQVVKNERSHPDRHRGGIP